MWLWMVMLLIKASSTVLLGESETISHLIPPQQSQAASLSLGYERTPKTEVMESGVIGLGGCFREQKSESELWGSKFSSLAHQ
jgi:hypothetical protein